MWPLRAGEQRGKENCKVFGLIAMAEVPLPERGDDWEGRHV